MGGEEEGGSVVETSYDIMKRENESLRLQLEQERRRRRSAETEFSKLKVANMNLQSEVEVEEEKITNRCVNRAVRISLSLSLACVCVWGRIYIHKYRGETRSAHHLTHIYIYILYTHRTHTGF